MAKEYLQSNGKMLMTTNGELVQVPDSENLNDLADTNGVMATQSEEVTNEIEDLIVNGVIDGSPRGVYANLSALQTAYPSGASGVYLTSDNGHWYYWNGSAWTDGGVYQATEIADGSVSIEKLDDNLQRLVIEKLDITLNDFIDFCKYDNINGKVKPIKDSTVDGNGNHLQALKQFVYIKDSTKIKMSGIAMGNSYFLDKDFNVINSLGQLFNNGNPMNFTDVGGNVSFDVNNENYYYLAVTQYSDVKNYYINKIKYQKTENVKSINFNDSDIQHNYRYEIQNGRAVIIQDNTVDSNGNHYMINKNIVYIGNSESIVCNAISTIYTYLLNDKKSVIETIGQALQNGDITFTDYGDGNVFFRFNRNDVRYIAMTMYSDVTNYFIVMNGFINNENEVIDLSFREKYRYLMTSFVSATMQLNLLGSNDLENWALVKENVYKPELGRGTLRDPAIAQIGDYYYITYTVIDWAEGSSIGMCRTKDFNNYEELPQLTFGSFNRVWAPEFFIDGFKVYIVASGTTDGNTFKTYLSEYNYKNHTIGELIQLDQTTNSGIDNIIDTNITKIGNTYYAIGKNESQSGKGLFIMKCNELFGTYEMVYNDNKNIFGICEGPVLVKLDNGKFRLYYDRFNETSSETKFAYSDSYDLINWTSPKNAKFDSTILEAHPYILDFNKILGNDIKPLSYSTSEIDTGKTWINGKKIYSKTYYVESITTVNSNITVLTDNMIKDLCTNHKFINYEATAYETNNVFLKLGSISDIDVKIWFNTYGELRMNTPKELKDLYVTIEYIK